MKPLGQSTALRVAAALLALAGLLTLKLGDSTGDLLAIRQLERPLAESIPREWEGWTGEDQPMAPKEIVTLRLDDYLRRRYVDASGRAVVLYVAYHGNKRRGIDTLYHNPTVCFPSQGYDHDDTQLTEITLRDRAIQIPVSRYLFSKGSNRISVLNFFRVGDEFLDQSPRNKPFWLLQEKMAPESPGTFVQVQILASYDSGDAAVAARLQERFLQSFGRLIVGAVE